MRASPHPILPTPRLTLRPMAVSDAEAVYTMIALSRESFSRWFGWAAGSSLASVRDYLGQAEEAMMVGTAWHYVVETRTPSLIGRVGLTGVDPINLSGELGYMLRTDFEGRGLMTEAAHALLSHAFGAGGRRGGAPPPPPPAGGGARGGGGGPPRGGALYSGTKVAPRLRRRPPALVLSRGATFTR